MKHASTQAALDYMKKLAGVSYDFELAEKLGYSKQALSSVKKRQKIPIKWFAKASLLFRVPMEELQTAGQLIKTANMYCGQNTEIPSELGREQDTLVNERRLFEEEKRRLWEERKELLAENRQLHREKEELLRENGELKAMVARLEERKNRLAVATDQPEESTGAA